MDRGFCMDSLYPDCLLGYISFLPPTRKKNRPRVHNPPLRPGDPGAASISACFNPFDPACLSIALSCLRALGFPFTVRVCPGD